MTTNLTPNKTHLAQLKIWLQQAYTDGFSRFIQHWHLIEEAFEEQKLIILKQSNAAIGFVVFDIDHEIATIDLAELTPGKRGQGLGKPFILDTLDYLKTQGALAVKLYCAPAESEGFWRKCGFERFEAPYDDHIHMSKLLTVTLETILHSGNTKKDLLKLWDCEPNEARQTEPKWIWELDYIENSKTLIKPIVIPVFTKWQLELHRESNIISRSMNRFPIRKWIRNRFLVIKEIPV
jgi:GNAT superfamily N-acetyltransferase